MYHYVCSYMCLVAYLDTVSPLHGIYMESASTPVKQAAQPIGIWKRCNCHRIIDAEVIA